MLRIEQGFDPSLYQTTDPSLNGYVFHHRQLVPSVIAYDMQSREAQEQCPVTRLEKVKNGLLRSATLSFLSDELETASDKEDWQAVRDNLGIKPASFGQSDWRIARGTNDRNSEYPQFGVWSATRNLHKNADVRVRERYTLAGDKSIQDTDIVAAIEVGYSHHDIVVATATTYALNKAVKKATYKPGEPMDWSEFPALAAARAGRNLDS